MRLYLMRLYKIS